MKSRESMVVKQVRLKQWAKQVQSCNNRPTEMTVNAGVKMQENAV